MTIHDATVEVTCDGPHCVESIEIEPEYSYRNQGAGSGHYDTGDEGINRKVLAEGWTYAKMIGGEFHHYCEGCNPIEEFDGHGGER